MYNNPDSSVGDNLGVSPVVGVILMVAVTVILSAVIATFVLDLGGGTNQNPSAGVTFDEADGEVTVQAVSMDNADKLEIHVDGEPEATIDNVGDIVSVPAGDVSIVGILDGNEATIQSYESDTVAESGTAENPIVINNVDELQAMENDLDAHYVLGSDIDAAETSTWNGGDGFEPIGGNGGEFTGTLDGQGYEIQSLHIDRGSELYVGLFGDSSGVVEDVGLVDADITGGDDTGGLFGRSWGGSISGSYVEGSVAGGDSVGGIVGSAQGGNVIESYSLSSVNGGASVGGLVGQNYGDVNEAYAAGVVTGGDTNVGGLVGYNSDGGSGEVSDSYWDTEATGMDDSDGGEGLSTTEMHGDAAETNMTGFDFGSAWTTVDGDYPVLVED